MQDEIFLVYKPNLKRFILMEGQYSMYIPVVLQGVSLVNMILLRSWNKIRVLFFQI